MPARAYRLLGGLDVVEPTGSLDLGTRKQRTLLAVLLLEAGRLVSLDRLVDALWAGAPPERAEASVHAYVSTLRRVLEPDRLPRQPATTLVTRGTGYALLVEREQVDAWRFADQVALARRRHADGDLQAAGRLLDEALTAYQPLLPEFADDEWTQADRIRLERTHAAGVRLSYDVRLARGEHRALEPELRAAAEAAPLDEELWALLAVALYRSGRQGEALTAVATCKRALADELGVDPGPRLRRLESDLLSQAPHLEPPRPHIADVADVAAARVSPDAAPAGPASATSSPMPARAPDGPTLTPGALVGRRGELGRLRAVVGRATAGGSGVVVVEGEAGAGKTRLLEELAAVEQPVRFVWGRCSHGAGVPALWPWTQVASALAGELTAPETGQLDPGAAFRQVEALAALLGGAAQATPLVVVLDDLHWADEASLGVLGQLVTRLPPRSALVIALRPPGSHAAVPLVQALAEVARAPGYEHLHVGGLSREEVGAVLSQETGTEPSASTTASVLARSGGNAFYVRELARLLARPVAAGPPGMPRVPASVRDVVRSRLATLPAPTTELLRLAAVMGRDVDPTVLARAAGRTVVQAFDALAPAADDGVLGPHPERTAWWRFSHDLVREAVVTTIAPLQAPLLHLQVADALEATGSDAVAEPLAHHLWSAGALADARRTAGALLRAAHGALTKSAYGAAHRHLELAAGVARSAGADDLELDAIALLVAETSVRVGYVALPDDVLSRGEELAARLGRTRVVGDLLYARWASASQNVRLAESAAHVARLRELARTSGDLALQVAAEHAWGIDQWDRGCISESAAAFDRAEAVYRRLGEGTGSGTLQYDVELLSPAFRALLTALRGHPDDARRQLDVLERQAAGDPYRFAVWAQFAANSLSLIGDVPAVLDVGARGIAADPDRTFAFLGTFLRVEHAWAQALLSGGDEARTACGVIEGLLAELEENGALSGEHGSLCLLAEARLAAGALDAADAALDAAEASVARWGQRFNEPLIHVVRARVLQARGASDAAVRAELDVARRMSVERGALLFAQRADQVLPPAS